MLNQFAIFIIRINKMFKTLAGIAAIFIDIKEIKRTIISNIIDIPSNGPANKFDKINVSEIVLN